MDFANKRKERIANKIYDEYVIFKFYNSWGCCPGGEESFVECFEKSRLAKQAKKAFRIYPNAMMYRLKKAKNRQQFLEKLLF